MKNLNSNKNKHMGLTDRNKIQIGLERGSTLKEIASIIAKDPTTVSKQIKRLTILSQGI